MTAPTHSGLPALAAAAILAGLALARPARAATHHVEAEDHVFIPELLSVAVGDTVVWIAKAPEHTVTADGGLFDSMIYSDSIPFGETFSFTFDTPGVFPYFCNIHGGPGRNGMSGVISVSATAENHPPATPANLSPAPGSTGAPLTPTLATGPFADPDPGDFHAASQWLVSLPSNGAVVFDSGEETPGRTSRTLPAGLLQPSSSYVWKVRHQDGRGLWSPYSEATGFTTLQPVAQEGVGLKVSLGNNAAPLVVGTNAVVDFNWGRERPHRRITADTFSAVWEGAVLPEFTEEYEFQLHFQGVASLWVDGRLLIDAQDGCGKPMARRAWIPLTGGRPASIRVQYAASAAGALASLRWASASLPAEVVPTRRLFPSLP